MKYQTKFSSVLLIALATSGCVTPFAQDITFDKKAYNAPGSIAVSDGRLYGRSLLVDERRDDLAWLNDQITKSKTAVFAPEIVREVEQISSFAAALGLKGDPAAGLNFRRDKEIGDIQQDIAVERVKLELEQLRADAKLFREKLAEQKDPVNTNLGQSSNASVADATNGVSAAAADQLMKAIDRLLPALKDRLDKADSPLARSATGASLSPYDEFRDRKELRDSLKSERNAAALDELHDVGGSALYRVNFLVTVVPDPKYLRSMGVVQLTPLAVKMDSTATKDFLFQWLRHTNLAARDGATAGGQQEETAFRFLEQADYLQRFILEIGPARTCRGVVESELINLNPGCTRASIYFPAILNENGAEVDLAKLFVEIEDPPATDSAVATIRPFAAAQGVLGFWRKSDPARNVRFLEQSCKGVRAPDLNADFVQIQSAIGLAKALLSNIDLFKSAERAITDAGLSAGGLTAKIRQEDEAQNFLAQIDADLASVPECIGRRFAVSPTQRPNQFWGRLAERLKSTGGSIRVYDIAPREKSQQISTVARSANSLALAASAAANVPGAGVGGEAALNYSRQAIGRAQALERIPSVVGYVSAGRRKDQNGQAEDPPSDGANTRFGWVFGPRSRIDPKKAEIRVEHTYEEHNLSVDLIAPFWASKLQLQSDTVWGPSPTALAHGEISTGSPRIIDVPLSKNAADFATFTDFLLGSAPMLAANPKATGLVNACSESYVTVTGRNLWRTTEVVVMGGLIEGANVRILPSMQGILVKVPRIVLPKGSLIEQKMTVLSPYNTVTVPIEYQDEPSGDTCSAKPAAATADTKAPKFAAFSPDRLEFPVPSKFRITVTGENLGVIDAVLLHGQKGELKKDGEGKELTIDFTRETSSGIPAPDIVKLEFRKGAETVETKPVRTQRSVGE